MYVSLNYIPPFFTHTTHPFRPGLSCLHVSHSPRLSFSMSRASASCFSQVICHLGHIIVTLMAFFFFFSQNKETYELYLNFILVSLLNKNFISPLFYIKSYVILKSSRFLKTNTIANELVFDSWVPFSWLFSFLWASDHGWRGCPYILTPEVSC